MADNARGIHVSPGVYSREIDITYAARSLGITTLGLAGETQRGPAFEPISIENWRDFQNTFGGTSTEKFRGNKYPKYELPYVAKSYLSESRQLEVCRVLGLSGYNAGPAWVITADVKGSDGKNKKMVVAVLRSRAYYDAYAKNDSDSSSSGACRCPGSYYDKLTFMVGETKATDNGNGDACPPIGYNKNALGIASYIPLDSFGNECEGYLINNVGASFEISTTNRGRFKIVGYKGRHSETELTYTDKATNPDYFEYAVSLNPSDKEYILNVLGTSNDDGDAPIFVESLYDVSLLQEIEAGNALAITHGPKIESGTTSAATPSKTEETTDNKANKVEGATASASGKNEPAPGKGEMTDKPDASTGKTDTTAGDTVGKGEEKNDDNAVYSLEFYQAYHMGDYCQLESVYGLMTKPEASLTKKDVGRRYLATEESTGITVHYYNYETGKPEPNSATTPGKTGEGTTTQGKTEETTASTSGNSGSTSASTSGDTGDTKATTGTAEVGRIYTVKQVTDTDGKRHYYYSAYSTQSIETFKNKEYTDDNGKTYHKTLNTIPLYDKLDSGTAGASCVENYADGLYYRLKDGKVKYITCDLDDYKSAYRYSSTPWIVSNLKGDYNKIEMTKLFRFHTISDGASSAKEVKVSIENILPDSGTFDVVVRRIDDTDESIIPLEKFGKCNMIPGDKNYIAYKIGSFDGLYESKSKYITVEVNETAAAQNSVPAGFLGYPMAQYNGLQVTDANDSHTDVEMPKLKYNTTFNNDVKHRKQYFGLSSRVGVDIDTFTFKGVKAYTANPDLLTNGFHLDSRLNDKAYVSGNTPTITVDGETGYKFDAVSTQNRTTDLPETPVIGKESDMYGSIYEYVDLRKFTVYFYGGFDGWDIYRDERTNTDDFKKSNYKGLYDDFSGKGYAFDRIEDPELLGLNQQGITSDWYAYLAAIRKFANPEAVDINVFATPGIDYVNNQSLVEEVIEMIEEERADSIYVVTTPDKPAGASDTVEEMYTPDDAVYNLENTEIDSNYTCTYYPWVKYLDQDNNQYIYLPPTKDAVRNFAQTDNVTYPWFAPAGIERGDVNCVRAHYITKLEDEDVLYEGRINPVKTFATDGVKIWGQKNLQIAESQLNRIAVRRLLLRMRKLIAIACRNLIFQPNDSTTKNQFLSVVTPIMDNIKSNRGISDYRVEVNDTVESRERRELPAKIFFKPYNALEYIVLDFIVTPESVSFDDI